MSNNPVPPGAGGFADDPKGSNFESDDSMSTGHAVEYVRLSTAEKYLDCARRAEEKLATVQAQVHQVLNSTDWNGWEGKRLLDSRIRRAVSEHSLESYAHYEVTDDNFSRDDIIDGVLNHAEAMETRTADALVTWTVDATLRYVRDFIDASLVDK